jgi:hypothetical protein
MEAMSRATIEERLEILESRVSQLQEELSAAKQRPARDWRRAVEKYAGDSDLQSIFAAAMKLREQDRARARKHATRKGPPRRKSR